MAIPAIRRFGRGDRLHVQAQRIWMILAGHVSGNGERRRRGELTLTYGELALRMGYDDTRAGHMLSRQLGIVGEYCLLNDLPALNAIVVNSKTGVAGEDGAERATTYGRRDAPREMSLMDPLRGTATIVPNRGAH